MSLVDLWESDTPDAWGARWGLPKLEIHDVIGSTNDRARELVEAGAEAFTAVIAEAQTMGRGREGRRWESPAGTGLWLSMIAPPREQSARALMPLRVGLAVCRAVERAAPGVYAGLKWPNDVLLDGRKVAGVLCESTPGGVVIGVGINVRPGSLPEPLTDTAVALEEASGQPVDLGRLAGELIAELRELLAPGSLGLEGDVAREIDARDVLKGRKVLADTGESGIARGIGRDGALRVELATGEVCRVMAGGVRIREG
ncbi:MAG: biotin--[acetyl-CoA-carboxylase] ligase [Gemmatimonadetes bacterium]|nr:biotin--[acetyl-CoA-carboxylase] ligase [Gemmatimonadota bacterium]